MKRVLVAGATGYLGGHIVTELKNRGIHVRMLLRHPDQAAALSQADESFVGQVTDPPTITGVAAGMDTVISTIGITKPTDNSSYDAVDYGGNLALLREAEHAGIKNFGYVALLHGRRLRNRVRMVAAKERFVDALTDSGVRHSIVRPTGFFSDMRAFKDMAAKGRTFLIGNGQHRINPISGRDLAIASLNAVETGTTNLDIGGPETFTHEDIAHLATQYSGRSWRVTHVPPRLLRGLVRTLRYTTPQRVWGPLQFFTAVMTMDMVAPESGTDHLADYLRQPMHDPRNPRP